MNSFRITDTKFRILKGGKIGLAMSIAMIGGMLSLGSVNAQADTITVLSSGGLITPSVQDMGYSVGLSTIDFAIQTPSIDALGIHTVNNYFIDDTTYTTYTTDTVYDNTITLYSGKEITGRTANNGELLGIYTVNDYQQSSDGDETDTTYNNTHFAGKGILNVQGNNIINGMVGVNYYSMESYIVSPDPIGTINLNGYNVTFGDQVYATTTYVKSGTNNTINNDYTFYGNLSSDLTFNQAASVLLNGGLSDNAHATGGNLNYNGYNSIVTLGANQTITGNVTSSGVNGTLIFQGAGTVQGDVITVANSSLEEVRANGIGNVLFTNTNAAEVDHVNYQAAATIGFNGGLNLTIDNSTDAVNTVTFNNHDGVLQINNGNLTGIEGEAVVTTTSNNKGTVTMVSGTQTITGNIGSTGHAIKKLNIGGESTGGLDLSPDNYSATTANGNIYAGSVKLFNNGSAPTNNSQLTMASEYSIYSTVDSGDASGMGILTLAGGDQHVTGKVGSVISLALVESAADGAHSYFDSDVTATTVTNTGTGTSDFANNVTATTINVDSGISNFTNNVTNVTATTTNIGTGVANFNTNGTGTTSSNIVFSANTAATTSSTGSYTTSVLRSATANLINGLTGSVNFDGYDATVNVWDGTGISNSITTLTNSNTGTVNYRGDGIISSTVGSSGLGIKELNINTNSEQNTSSGVTANGNIYAGVINLKNNGILTLSDNINITGETDVIPLTSITQVISTQVADSGTIKILGTSSITGVVGASNASIGTIEAGVNSEIVTFNNMVYAKNLNYAGNGTVVLNGQTGTNVNTAGMVGTIDFGTNVTNTGTLQIGDNVNLTTGISGINFVDANGATLTFNGSSIINGNVGSLSGTDTFITINAGRDSETVRFNDNIYFMDSLNLSEDGIIEIANNKYAQRSSTTGAIITTTYGKGTLNYLGNTVLYGEIGTTGKSLNAVNFNTATNNVVQKINYDVYATNTTVGHTSSINDSSINLTDVTGQYDYAGATTIKEFRGQTAANITDDITFGGNLIISDAKSAINFGTSHVTVDGDFTTNDGAMSFTVNTRDNTSGNQAASTSSGSGQVTTAALNMSGSEKVHINYVGSLANNGTYTLISDTGTTGTGTYSHVDGDGKVTDNSFAIDTKIDKTAGISDLILRADRTAGGNYSADQLYVQKSDTNGHFSNNAAVALAGISANGSQTDDMIEVIQKLELDSFGYGNSKENLAVQVQKLAPIVNTSFAQTSISATKLVTDTVGSRLSDTRGLSSGDAIVDKGVWAKVIGSTASQDKVGQFDGYSLSSGGVVFGIDKELQNNTIIGLAAGYTNTKTEQDDFRDGDSSTTDSYQLSLYASKTFDKAYIDGALSYTKHNTDGTRSSAIGREASYDVDANQLSAKINGGYNFLFENKVTLTPFASLEYSNIKQDSYKEEGAGAISLSVDDVTVNRGAAGLGVKISKEIKTEDNVVYIPEFKLGANKYFGDDDVEVTAQFDQGNKFVTKGAEMSDMMYNAGLGLKTKFTEDTSVSLSTDYERSNDGDFQGVNGQLTFRMQF